MIKEGLFDDTAQGQDVSSSKNVARSLKYNGKNKGKTSAGTTNSSSSETTIYHNVLQQVKSVEQEGQRFHFHF